MQLLDNIFQVSAEAWLGVLLKHERWGKEKMQRRKEGLSLTWEQAEHPLMGILPLISALSTNNDPQCLCSVL